jgi:hypothetical protein
MYNTKKDAITDIFDIEDIASKIRSWKLVSKITVEQLLETMSKDSYTLATELNVSSATGVSVVRTLWPDKPKNNNKICIWLLAKYGLKQCSHCKKVKEHEYFSKNASRPTGYNSHCKECYLETTREYQKEYQKTRKAMQLDRVPKWADIDKIKEIYLNCPKGYHVDHIVPLQGALVSGFHVENNLQYLTAEENLKKHNKFDV